MRPAVIFQRVTRFTFGGIDARLTSIHCQISIGEEHVVPLH